jgi:hypothetical protein
MTRSSTRRETPADHRSHPNHITRGEIEPFETSQKHVLNAVGNVDFSDRPHQSDFVPLSLQQAALLQRSQDLFHERIAIGLVVKELLQLDRQRRRTQERATDRARIASRDPGKCQLRAKAPCANGSAYPLRWVAHNRNRTEVTLSVIIATNSHVA